jgi:FkbM family methyltransferase
VSSSRTETSTIDVGNASVEMVIDGDIIMQMMGSGKSWEPETRAAWQSLIAPEAMALDVGAYTGVYSIASAHMGAEVIALEPHPANFARLKLNATINSARIDMRRLAASDVTGPHLLRASKPMTVIHDIGSMTACLEHPAHAIESIRIDDIEFAKPLCLIKIDVEHHERSVLRGAMKTIEKHHPLILVEVLSVMEGDEIDAMLKPLRYSLLHVLDKRNYLYGLGGVE